MSNQKSIAALLGGLRFLTKEQRKEAAARLAYLDQREEQDPVKEVYNGLVLVVGDGFPPLVRIQKSSKVKTVFSNGCKAIHDFQQEVFGNQGRYGPYILGELLWCCVSELKEGDQELSAWRLGVKMQHIFNVISRAFPGYLESGCFKEVFLAQIKAKRINRENDDG